MSGRPFQPTSLIERALEMAHSGAYATITDIAKALKAEGFTRGNIEIHLGGQSIRKQLRDACKAAIHGG